MNRIIPHLVFALIALVFATIASAALYNIVGTQNFVNGLPPSLTTKERAKLVTATIAQTDSAIIAGKYTPLDRASAKAKIKQIIASETVVIPPVVVQPVSLMPFVDVTKNMIPAVGFNSLRIAPTTEQPTPSSGDFRIECSPSHMSNDDPIIFPNQPGATHHHTFFGNTSVKYNSDLMNLSEVGNSTCSGGIMNRSAYWAPSMIDTTTNAPIVPSFALFYYKTGVDGALVKAPPKGLRMVAGNSKATSLETAQSQYTCIPPDNVSRPFFGWHKAIPNCVAGDSMQMVVGFPQCWDGKNLDSPNHIDHMTNAVNGACPAAFPVAIPQITVTLSFKVTADNQTAKWRLASDNYAFDGKNAGYSAHADWVNGWNEVLLNTWLKGCINAKMDCRAHLLGNGNMFY